jgi:hypothetical protein
LARELTPRDPWSLFVPESLTFRFAQRVVVDYPDVVEVEAPEVTFSVHDASGEQWTITEQLTTGEAALIKQAFTAMLLRTFPALSSRSGRVCDEQSDARDASA